MITFILLVTLRITAETVVLFFVCKIKIASRGDRYLFHVPLLRYFSTSVLSTFVSTPLLNTTLYIVPAGVAVPVNPFFNLNLNICIPPWVRKRTPTKGAFLITFISRYHINTYFYTFVIIIYEPLNRKDFMPKRNTEKLLIPAFLSL